MLAVRTRSLKRPGAAAVELAICAPVLIILIAGIWEVGRMVQAQQLICNAVREGGRRVSAGKTDNAGCRQAVVDYLTINGIQGVSLADVTLDNLTKSSRSDPRDAEQMDRFRVFVSVPYSKIQWSVLKQLTSTTTLSASADWYSMRDIPISVTVTLPAN